MTDKLQHCQSAVPELFAARAGTNFCREFGDIYPPGVIPRFLSVGPMSAYLGMLVRDGSITINDNEWNV